MKYLIFKDFGGQPVTFIFPRKVDHADMRDQLPYGELLAAGYIELVNGAFLCSGGCVELSTTARPEDAALIAKALTIPAQ